MSETITCPAKGCDYNGLKKSVLGHYSGKQDDAHAGGYEKAKQLLNGDTEATETSTETSDSSGGSNPTMGNGETEPDDNGVELPCGHEKHYPDEAEHEPPYRVTCESCGEAWRWTT